jgi:hypothetical protein
MSPALHPASQFRQTQVNNESGTSFILQALRSANGIAGDHEAEQSLRIAGSMLQKVLSDRGIRPNQNEVWTINPEDASISNGEWHIDTKGGTAIHKDARGALRTIGSGVKISSGAEVGPATSIGNYVTIGEGVKVGSNVRLEHGSELLTNCIIEDRSHIGHFVQIPAGASVGHDSYLDRSIKFQGDPERPFKVGACSIVGRNEIISADLPAGTLRGDWQTVFNSWKEPAPQDFNQRRKEAIAEAIESGSPYSADPDLLDEHMASVQVAAQPVRTVVIESSTNGASRQSSGISLRQRFGEIRQSISDLVSWRPGWYDRRNGHGE